MAVLTRTTAELDPRVPDPDVAVSASPEPSPVDQVGPVDPVVPAPATGRPAAPRTTGPAADLPAVELAVPCWTRLAGQALVALGGLMVAFAAFQLWGTSLIERQAQRALSAELDPRPSLGSALLPDDWRPADDTRPRPGPAPGAAGHVAGSARNIDPATVGPDPGPTPAPGREALAPLGWVGIGDPVGRIDIPAIGLSKAFVEGVDRDVLRQGPGHYPGTALPGHPGNTAIAGHRTTHGAPFYHLDELVPGDEIVVTTPEGEFHYVVDAHTTDDGDTVGHVIVTPDDVSVLADEGDNRLTLTACHPRYSARQRIVVTAHLVGPALEPAATGPSDGRTPGADGAATEAAATGIPADGPTGGPAPAAPASAPAPDVVGPTADPVPAPAIPVSPAEQAQRRTMVAVPAAMGAAGAAVANRPPAATVSVGLDGAGLGWQDDQLAPTLLWATVCAVLAHAAWIGGRLWRRRWAYGTGAVAIVPCLFVCFIHLDRVLPAF